MIVDGEEEWEVETIFDSRLHYNRLQYLVKWKGYDVPTWQPVTDLEHSSELVRVFHQLWPDRPYKIFPIYHRAVLAGTSLQQDVQAGKSSTSV